MEGEMPGRLPVDDENERSYVRDIYNIMERARSVKEKTEIHLTPARAVLYFIIGGEIGDPTSGN